MSGVHPDRAAQPPAGARRVAICIATCQRPSGLGRLLRALEGLDVEGGEALSPEIVVVDNDPALSARTLCEQFSSESKWPITYVSEPRRGTPFARNAVVRCALGRGAGLLALIDDDEVPDTNWLRELLDTMARHAADVVTGPVLPHFEGAVPRWVLAGGFFDATRQPTGTPLDQAYTNNVLLRAEVFTRVGRLFDERFLLGVGEDTDFFLHAAAAGCTIVWADDAVVREWIPENRTRVGWLVRRSYHVGVTWAALRHHREAHRRGALRGLVKGALWLPGSVFQGRQSLVRALQLVATGMGYVAGTAGLRSSSDARTTRN